MISILRTRAENRFAAIEKSQQKAISEQEEKALKISENTARLRALRLAKETAELAGGPRKTPSQENEPIRRLLSKR